MHGIVFLKWNNYLSRLNALVFSSALTNLGTLFSVILGLHPNLQLYAMENLMCKFTMT